MPNDLPWALAQPRKLRSRLACGILIAALTAWNRTGPAAEPADNTTDYYLELPSTEELLSEKQTVKQETRDLLRQAELLYKLGKWDLCQKTCDRILQLDPGQAKARVMSEKCNAAKDKEVTANLDVERRLRDTAALHEVTREGLIPPTPKPLLRPMDRDKNIAWGQDPEQTAAARALLGQRLPEINLIDADINYVLQLLFKTTGVNIVYNPADLQDKKVTIHARDLTLEDVLKYLSRTLGVGYLVDNNTVWVYGVGDEQAARALMRPAIIPLKVGLTSAGGGGGTGGGSGGGDAKSGGGSGGGASASSSAASDIEELLSWMEKNWPGWPEQTKWHLDRKMNRLVIASTPAILEDGRRMVATIDVAPIQVLIVARFISVTEKTLDKLGFNWSITPNPNIIPQTTGDNATNNAWQDNKNRLTGGSANIGVDDASVTLGTVSILNEHQVAFTMQAINQATGTKVLTAPRVIALNNKPATIKMQSAYPYPTNWETVTAGTSGTDTSSTATSIIPTDWAEQDLGVRLDVFPSVGADLKTITLQIEPEITELQEKIKYQIVTTNATGNQQTADVERPIFKTETLQVEAVVEDGQTVVVGGLFKDNFNEGKKAVPGLEKLPLVGGLFKSRSNDRERSCLLIFVTARIINSNNRGYTDLGPGNAQECPPGAVIAPAADSAPAAAGAPLAVPRATVVE